MAPLLFTAYKRSQEEVLLAPRPNTEDLPSWSRLERALSGLHILPAGNAKATVSLWCRKPYAARLVGKQEERDCQGSKQDMHCCIVPCVTLR